MKVNTAATVLVMMITGFWAATSAAAQNFPGLTVYERPERAFVFALPDQTGKTFDLASSQGKPMVLSFIFTHCADVCPFVAVKIRETMDLLPRAGSGVTWVAVTVDPVRDTLPVIADYSRALGLYDRWHFLTGKAAEIEYVLARYHVAATREEGMETMPAAEGSETAKNLPSPGFGLSSKGLALAKEVARKFSGGYDVSHSVTFVIVDDLGRMRATAEARVAPADLARAITSLGQ